MKMLNKCFSALLALALLLSLCAPAALAAEDPAVVHIYTAEDLAELSRQSSLDSWSRGKTVLLENSIDLSSVDFQPIPSFGGTFDGQGHTISGFDLRSSGDVQGLFRYVQESGVIRDLTVEGTLHPVGDRDHLGGIAGENRGTISHCTFRGTVSGKNTAGGIAGINEAGGQILNSSFYGTLTGEHYAGGIAGQNLGSIVQCINNGEINTTEVKSSLTLEDIDLGQLNSTENAPVSTDIGGIAGFSSGVIQSCKNLGDVGYPHVGYNVGGIAGRQTGYLDGCTNEGTILGRKDVGGIAGQLEPDLTLKYDETTLNKIWGELDALESAINTLLDDASGSVHSLTDQIQAVSDSAGAVKNAVADLADALTGWADGSIGQINDASARVSWVLERVEPILDTMELAVDQMEKAAGQFSDGLSQTGTASEIGADAAAAMSLAMADIEDAIGSGRAAFDHINQAIANVKRGLGDPNVTADALQDLTGGLSELAEAFSGAADGLHRVRLAMDEVYQWVSEDPNWQLLKSGVDDLLLAVEAITAALGKTGAAVEAIAEDQDWQAGVDLVTAAVSDLLNSMVHLGDAYYDISAALAQFRENILPDFTACLQAGLLDISSAGQSLSCAMDEINTAVNEIAEDENLKTALEQLTLAAQYLESAMASVMEIERLLTAALDAVKAGDPKTAIGDLREASSCLKDAGSALSAASEHLAGALQLMNESGAFEGARTHLQSAFDQLSAAADHLSSASRNFAAAIALLEGGGMEEIFGLLSDGFSDLDAATADLLSAIDNLQSAVDRIETSETLPLHVEALKAGVSGLNDGIIALSAALDRINAALDGLDASAVPEDAAASLRLAAEEIDQCLQDAGSAAERITAALEKLEESLDPAALETAMTDLQDSISDLDQAADGLVRAVGHMRTAADGIEEAADQLGAAFDTFSQAGSSLKSSFSLLEQAAGDIDALLEELVRMPAIRIENLEDSIADEGTGLNTAANGFFDSVSALTSALRSESDVLTDDLKAVNAQIDDIVDLIHQALQEQAEIETESPLEDVSGQDSGDTRSTGKISSCINRGTVEGDINVAGIVGSMAIEYDFDPEDDLTISGSRTLNGRYLVKAVVRNCVNHGQVIAKKDQAGGIVGSMDFGRVIACEGYGSVTSTGGGYVGGIAGIALGGIQDSWAMCRLSGSTYVGGIAGSGSLITNCRTLIDLEPGGSYVGAIAGHAEEGAQLTGNLFVHQLLAGVDGVSYAGAAEPVTYQALCALDDLPKAFTEFRLTFTADGAVVEQIPFQYGDSLEQLPDIPEKAGYTAAWPDLDFSSLTFSQTVEAVYTPYSTALSDGQPLPQMLVSGSFPTGTEAVLTEAETEWSSAGTHYSGTVHTVTVAGQSAFTLHWRLPEAGTYDLWVQNGGRWEQRASTVDGSYLLLDCTGESITFCLVERDGPPILPIILSSAAVILVILAAILLVKKAKRRKMAAA